MRASALKVAAFFLCIAALGASVPSVARAADPPSSENSAAAESLFRDGRKLMTDQRYPEACAKFAASQRLAPAVGTLLNLGDCYEKLGKTASAWATYVDAASAAQRLNRPDRERSARALATAVEGKLSRLTLRVDKTVPGLQITRDGVLVDDAALGVAVPLDPGKHELQASAPGKKPWTSSVDVAAQAKLEVRVPALEDEPVHTRGILDDSALNEPEAPPPPDSSAKTRRILGIGLVGLGVAGVGAGTFFGLKARSTWSDAQGQCTNNLCNDDGLSLASDAKTAGNISTVTFIAGAVALAAGVVLVLTAPSKRSSPSRSSQATRTRRSF